MTAGEGAPVSSSDHWTPITMEGHCLQGVTSLWDAGEEHLWIIHQF